VALKPKQSIQPKKSKSSELSAKEQVEQALGFKI